MSDFIILSERVKELSRTEGAINFSLDGAVNGFSSFSDTYSSGDPVFYAITDGTDYEVGSGVYGNDGINSYIIRSSPFKSTNSDALVSFTPGVKEVYVTYPGKFSVFTASGLGSFEQPDVSGVAFWGSQNILDYDSAFIWDKTNNRLGVSESAPQYSIHVGGTQQTSKVAASGFVVGNSGVNFVGDDPSYSGGVQLEPFLRTELDVTTGTSAVFALSGLVDQRILFQTQLAGTVLAGPASGDCSGGCDPDYPVFRALVLGDVPDLSTLYLVQKEDAYSPTMGSGIAFFSSSGVIDTDPNFAWNKTYNILDLKGDALISGQLSVGGNVVVTGNLDVQGDVTYSDSTITVSGVQANSFQLLSGGYVPVAGTGYTLSNTDNGKVLLFSHNSDILLTVASGLDFGLATSFIQLGSGQIEVSGAAGVNIYNSQSHTRTNTQHSRAGLMHYAQDVYNFAGDTAT